MNNLSTSSQKTIHSLSNHYSFINYQKLLDRVRDLNQSESNHLRSPSQEQPLAIFSRRLKNKVIESQKVKSKLNCMAVKQGQRLHKSQQFKHNKILILVQNRTNRQRCSQEFKPHESPRLIKTQSAERCFSIKHSQSTKIPIISYPIDKYAAFPQTLNRLISGSEEEHGELANLIRRRKSNRQLRKRSQSLLKSVRTENSSEGLRAIDDSFFKRCLSSKYFTFSKIKSLLKIEQEAIAQTPERYSGMLSQIQNHKRKGSFFKKSRKIHAKPTKCKQQISISPWEDAPAKQF